MRQFMRVTAFVYVGAALLGSSSARADVATLTPTPLLSLINPPDQTDELYTTRPFTANGETTTISFSGYQTGAFEYVSGISVTLSSGGPNLLEQSTSKLTQPPPGAFAGTLVETETQVPELWFGGSPAGVYDTFYWTFATDQGSKYVLNFDFTDGVSFFFGDGIVSGLSDFVSSSALQVATSGSAPAVPEPSTWAMMMIGLAGLGLAGHRRRARLERTSP